MPPKFDPNAITILYIRVKGGEAGGVASLAPKVGPLGLSPKKIGDDIAAATQEWKGLKITCKLIIQNRQAKVEVVPSAAVLLIKALKEPLRTGKYPLDAKQSGNTRRHEGNLPFSEIVEVAKAVRARSLSKTMNGTVREVLGSAVSIGCTVEGQDPREIQKQVKEGKWNEKIPDE